MVTWTAHAKAQLRHIHTLLSIPCFRRNPHRRQHTGHDVKLGDVAGHTLYSIYLEPVI